MADNVEYLTGDGTAIKRFIDKFNVSIRGAIPIDFC